MGVFVHMKKSEIKKLDILWSEAVKIAAGNKCLVCGKTKYLNSHHFYSRSNQSVRWAIENGCSLCSGHHTLCNNSAHKAPADFVEFMIEERGEKWLADLRVKKNTIRKQFYEEVRQELEDFIADYLAHHNCHH